jgi:hypothetical protein
MQLVGLSLSYLTFRPRGFIVKNDNIDETFCHAPGINNIFILFF